MNTSSNIRAYVIDDIADYWTMTMTMTMFLLYIIILRKELYNINKLGNVMY